ncbi:MAG: hypothetical protein ACTHMJ_13310 [Thermomicrobiales bacterium]|jgi:hypothetical protein|nr:hypothetical protein [Thermomicrobiales bacterium]
MAQTITAIFDGEVLRPEAPTDLVPHSRYRLTIVPVSDSGESPDAWDTLEALAGSLDMPADWSAEHDHYLYGTPKQPGESKQ